MPLARRACLSLAIARLSPRGFLATLLGVETGQGPAGAEATRAPSMPGIEGKKPWIQLWKAAPASGAGAAHGKQQGRPGTRARDLHAALAKFQALAQQIPDPRFGPGLDAHLPQRQFDIVFDEPVEPRPACRRRHLAVDAQLVEPAACGPARELGVVALARNDQRRQHLNVPPAQVAHDAGQDGFRALRCDADIAVRAVLGPKACEQQAEKVIDLGHRGDRALLATAARALLDGDRGRNAEDRIHVGPGGRLHELPRVGVQRFEITALALGKQDVESERALAAAADACDHAELVPRDRDVNVLEVMLAGMVDAYGVIGLRCRRDSFWSPMEFRRLRPGPHRLAVRTERLARVRFAHGGHVAWRAGGDDLDRRHHRPQGPDQSPSPPTRSRRDCAPRR